MYGTGVAAGGSGGGGAAAPAGVVAKSGNTAVSGSSGTYVNDPDLEFDFGANEIWQIEFSALGTITETSGLKVILATSVGSDADLYADDSLTWDDDFDDLGLTGLLDLYPGGHQGFINPTHEHRTKYRGYLKTTTAGTFHCAFAPEVDNEVHSVRRGSYLAYNRIL